MQRVRTFLLTAMLLVLAQSAAGRSGGMPALDAEIERLAQGSGGVVGVAAWRLDGKGPKVLANPGVPFPMASTFKVAVAGALLSAVDQGRVSLDDMIAIDRQNYVPSEVIAERFVHPGVSLSIANLLELMLTESDNTATDLLMDVAGGPQAVTRWVESQGVRGQRIDRGTEDLLRDFFDLPPLPFAEAMAAAEQADPALMARGAKPNARFDDDPRDTSTPEAMAELLTHIFRGQALSAESTAILKEIMQRCRTGEARLKGRLPSGAIVAHKTGTIGGTVNDVGVMTLPGDRGHLVIAVFVKESSLPFEARELAIAEIARTIRDYYLLADGF